jgi:hypothetical protein
VDGVRTTGAGSGATSEIEGNAERWVVSPPIARKWFGRPQRRTSSDVGRWPFRVGICATFATAVAASALLTRADHTGLGWTVVALTAVAALPWIVDLLVVEVPPWIFAPAVIVPVAVLHDPSRFDPFPLILAILALDMALWLGMAKSVPVVLVSAAVIVWPMPETTNDPGWLGRPLGVMIVIWLVGLVLHSQTQRVAVLRRRADVLGNDVVHLHVPAIRQALASARNADDPDEIRRSLQRAEDHLDQLTTRFTAPPESAPRPVP